MEHPILKKQFEIRVKVDTPIVVGQDGKSGRRQLIEITSGVLTGCEGGDFEGERLSERGTGGEICRSLALLFLHRSAV